jgi:hypothetical protein
MKDEQKAKNREKFKALLDVLGAMTKKIDAIFDERKKMVRDLKIKTLEEGFKSRKEFLSKCEADAIVAVSKELGMAPSLVRDRWKVMTLPMPIYGAMEDGDIPFAKAKLATPLSLDPDDAKSIESAERIAKKMIETDDVEEIKKTVADEAKAVWNPSTAVMGMLMEQAAKAVPSK